MTAHSRDGVRRVLLLTHRVPYPPDRGDRIRSFHLLQALASRFDVRLASIADEPVTHEQQRVLATLTRDCAIQRVAPMLMRRRAAWALVRGESLTAAALYDPRLAARIEAWHATEPFDAVVTFCTGMSRYAAMVRSSAAQPVRHVLDLVDVDSLKWQAYADQSAPPMRWLYAVESRRLRRIERGDDGAHAADHQPVCETGATGGLSASEIPERFPRHWQASWQWHPQLSRTTSQIVRYDTVAVVSDAEADAYREHVRRDAPLHVIPNGVDLARLQPTPLPSEPVMAFVGVMNYRPNVEAMRWFCERVMPHVRATAPGARLLIVGRDPSPAVLRLSHSEGVQVVGRVEDVRPYLAQARVVIAPLQTARGVQNKVLEAMAAGRPVVCTSAAARGIHAQPGRDLLVADAPQTFTDHLASLFTDDALARGLADAGRRCVQHRYRWDAAMQRMIELVIGVGAADDVRRAA